MFVLFLLLFCSWFFFCVLFVLCFVFCFVLAFGFCFVSCFWFLVFVGAAKCPRAGCESLWFLEKRSFLEKRISWQFLEKRMLLWKALCWFVQQKPWCFNDFIVFCARCLTLKVLKWSFAVLKCRDLEVFTNYSPINWTSILMFVLSVFVFLFLCCVCVFCFSCYVKTEKVLNPYNCRTKTRVPFGMSMGALDRLDHLWHILDDSCIGWW